MKPGSVVSYKESLKRKDGSCRFKGGSPPSVYFGEHLIIAFHVSREAAIVLLERLDVWEHFDDGALQSTPGIVSVWGRETPYNNDFVFNPFGPGWHLDRARFDRILAEAARAAGATMVTGRVSAVSYEQGWMVEAMTAAGAIVVRAKFLVDATGRRGWPGRQAYPRRAYDRLVAFAGILDDSRSATDSDQRTLIEAVSDGWWYCAPVPGNRMVAVFFTDSNLAIAGRCGPAPQLDTLLALAPPHITERVRGYRLACAATFSANGTLAERVCGANWIAIGDAACTFDPLSSQGVMHALQSALAAAGAILQSGAERERALNNYRHSIERSFEKYLKPTRISTGRKAAGRLRNSGAAVGSEPPRAAFDAPAALTQM
jgi:flavin-dependent dehydrogenase